MTSLETVQDNHCVVTSLGTAQDNYLISHAWVLGHQVDINAVAKFLVGITIIAFSLWLFGNSTKNRSKKHRILKNTSLISLGLWGILIACPTETDLINTPLSKVEEKNLWIPWSQEIVEKNKGKPIIVDFTAAWCVTCQVNKTLVFL